MNCINHPERESIGTCERCWKQHCEECLVNVSGRMNCRECLKDAPLPRHTEYGGNESHYNQGHSQNEQSLGDGNQVVAILLLVFFPLFGVIYTFVTKPFGKTGQNVVLWIFVIIPIILFLLAVLFATAGYAMYR